MYVCFTNIVCKLYVSENRNIYIYIYIISGYTNSSEFALQHFIFCCKVSFCYNSEVSHKPQQQYTVSFAVCPFWSLIRKVHLKSGIGLSWPNENVISHIFMTMGKSDLLITQPSFHISTDWMNISTNCLVPCAFILTHIVEVSRYHLIQTFHRMISKHWHVQLLALSTTSLMYFTAGMIHVS